MIFEDELVKLFNCMYRYLYRKLLFSTRVVFVKVIEIDSRPIGSGATGPRPRPTR